MSESSTTSTCSSGGNAQTNTAGTARAGSARAADSRSSSARAADALSPGPPPAAGGSGGSEGSRGPRGLRALPVGLLFTLLKTLARGLPTLLTHRASSGGSRAMSSTGNSMTNVQPWPSPLLSHQILPPVCCVTMPFVMNKPKPLPPPPCSLLALICVPSVNSLAMSLAARPAPLSLTLTRTTPAPGPPPRPLFWFPLSSACRSLGAASLGPWLLRGDHGSCVRGDKSASGLRSSTVMVTLPPVGVNWSGG